MWPKLILAIGSFALAGSAAWTFICGLNWTAADGHPMKLTLFGSEYVSLYAALGLDAFCTLIIVGGALWLFRGRRRRRR